MILPFPPILEISNAFDLINRAKLMDYLEETLNESKLHMMDTLINDVLINERCEEETVKDSITNVGTCQEDSLSAVLLVFYLAKSLKSLTKYIEKQDNDATMW